MLHFGETFKKKLIEHSISLQGTGKSRRRGGNKDRPRLPECGEEESVSLLPCAGGSREKARSSLEPQCHTRSHVQMGFLKVVGSWRRCTQPWVSVLIH